MEIHNTVQTNTQQIFVWLRIESKFQVKLIENRNCKKYISILIFTHRSFVCIEQFAYDTSKFVVLMNQTQTYIMSQNDNYGWYKSKIEHTNAITNAKMSEFTVSRLRIEAIQNGIALPYFYDFFLLLSCGSIAGVNFHFSATHFYVFLQYPFMSWILAGNEWKTNHILNFIEQILE